MDRIIVWDGGRWGARVGSIVEEGQQLRMAEKEARELVTLPAVRPLIEQGPNCGYAQRAWGSPGVVLEGVRPQRVCPLLLWVVPDLPFVHMAVQLDEHRDAVKPSRPEGTLRITAWPTSPSTYTGGVSGIDAIELGLSHLFAAATGSVIARARARLSVQVPGFVAVCLSGVARGASVAWTAATQAGDDRW